MQRSTSVECLLQSAAAGCTLQRSRSNNLTLRLLSRHRVALPVAIPSELWGATQLALTMCRNRSSKLTRAASGMVQVFSTAPAAVAVDSPKSISEALDFEASLPPSQDALSLLAAAVVCAGVYFASAPRALHLPYAAGMALLYAVLVALCRGWLLERQYKAIQRSEAELAGAGSRFLTVAGVAVHYKTAVPPPGPLALTPPTLALHCLHGFGASLFSWGRVQRELAAALRCPVTSHDMPGFGLTQRPSASRYYTLDFNGEVAREVMDAELSRLHPQQPQQAQQRPAAAAAAAAAATPAEKAGPAGSDADLASAQPRRILCGHSMGAAAVVEGVIRRPEGVAALVLVAPAVVALWPGPPAGASADLVTEGLALMEEAVSAQDPHSPAALSSSDSLDSVSTAGSEGAADGGGTGSGRRRKGRKPLLRTAAAVARAAAFVLVRAFLALASPLVTLLLRRLVRSRRFWERGLSSAVADPSQVTREVVDGYRLPQLVRGWEGGMLRFLAARFAERAGFWAAVHDAVYRDGHLTQAERLAEVVAEHNIRVLIIHGANDLLVPPANSRRLARLLPGAALAEFERCGHMPQEEQPERFVEVVKEFAATLA